MTDVFSKEQRSNIMKAVKSSGNKSTEQKLLAFFKKHGIKGWRRTYKVYGEPDFVFPKKKVAVFADGCFWHGHDCRNTKPKDNADYWSKKISRNIERDIHVTERLTKKGWTVIRLWECEIKKDDILFQRLNFLLN